MGQSKVYLEDGDHANAKMFEDAGWMVVDNPVMSDLICFGGGSDVSPALYGEINSGDSSTNPTRDIDCVYLWGIGTRYGIPMVGICRGGQFLNVMNGGTMHQHINGHGISGTHSITMKSDDLPGHMKVFQGTSVHHQGMIPNEDFLVDGIHGKADDGVHEVLLYEGIDFSRSLCFQPHPEYHGADDCREVFFYLIDNFLMQDISDED